MGTNSSVTSPASPPRPNSPRLRDFFLSAGSLPSLPGTTAMLSSKKRWNWFLRWDSWVLSTPSSVPIWRRKFLMMPVRVVSTVPVRPGFWASAAGCCSGWAAGCGRGSGCGWGLDWLDWGCGAVRRVWAGVWAAARAGACAGVWAGRAEEACRAGAEAAARPEAGIWAASAAAWFWKIGRSASRSLMACVEKRDSGSFRSPLTSTAGMSASEMGPSVAVKVSSGAVLRGMVRRMSSTLLSVMPSRIPLASCSRFSSCRMRSTESLVRLLGMVVLSPFSAWIAMGGCGDAAPPLAGVTGRCPGGA